MSIGVEFISASTAGIVHVELGFVPDYAILFQNHADTAPNIRLYVNGGSGKTFPNWVAARSLLLTGTTGVVSGDDTGMTVYAGGDVIASAETANTAGKHIDLDGNPAAAGHRTSAGISIPADHQTNSGRNLLIAFRHDA